MRILIFLTVLTVLALVALMRLPFLYSWVYFALAGLFVGLLLTMGALAAFHRMKQGRSRTVATVLIGFVAFVVLYTAGTMSHALATELEVVIGKFPSPERTSQVAVVRTLTDDEAAPYRYMVWPMYNDFMAERIEGYDLVTDSPVIDVEWLSEDHVRMFVPGSGGAQEVNLRYDQFAEEPAGG